jgi:hypothetical protein
MKTTTRIMVAAALMVASDLAPDVALAQQSGVKRTDLQRHDMVEGSLEYEVEGKPPVTLKAGDVLFIPAGTAHAARNVGSVNAAELATYIVEKGKPLLTVSR